MVSFMAVACLRGVRARAGDGGPHPFRGAQSWRGILPETRPGDKRKIAQRPRGARGRCGMGFASRRIPLPYRAGMVSTWPGRTTFGSGRAAAFASRMSGHRDASP